jgi:hypothetical protein
MEVPQLEVRTVSGILEQTITSIEGIETSRQTNHTFDESNPVITHRDITLEEVDEVINHKKWHLREATRVLPAMRWLAAFVSVPPGFVSVRTFTDETASMAERVSGTFSTMVAIGIIASCEITGRKIEAKDRDQVAFKNQPIEKDLAILQDIRARVVVESAVEQATT